MSQLADRLLKMSRASQVLATAVQNLASLPVVSPEAREARKKIEDSLEQIEREAALIQRFAPLPATRSITDRAAWEYDVQHDIPKLLEQCRAARTIAIDGQIAWESQKTTPLAPTDPKSRANIQRDLFDSISKIQELGKRILGLCDAIASLPAQPDAVAPAETPRTGAELLDLLEMSGSPTDKLRPGRDLIAIDPNATAKAVYDALEAARTVSEETLRKAKDLFGELRKPITLKKLAYRLTNLIIEPNVGAPFRSYFKKAIDSIPEWDFIKYACEELYGETDTKDLRVAGKKWTGEIERLERKLRFERKLENAGEIALAEVLPHIEALLVQIRTSGPRATQTGKLLDEPPVGATKPPAIMSAEEIADPFARIREEEASRILKEKQETEEWERGKPIAEAARGFLSFDRNEFAKICGRPLTNNNVGEFIAAFAPRIVRFAQMLASEKQDLWKRLEQLVLTALPAEAEPAVALMKRGAKGDKRGVIDLLHAASKNASIFWRIVNWLQNELMKTLQASDPIRGKAAEPPSAPPTAIDQISNHSQPKGLPPSRLKAYRQYEYAVKENAALDGATDRAVYDWLKEHLEEEDANRMPRASTFADYLKEARRHYDTQKHTSRSGRATGKSVVNEDQV